MRRLPLLCGYKRGGGKEESTHPALSTKMPAKTRNVNQPKTLDRRARQLQNECAAAVAAADLAQLNGDGAIVDVAVGPADALTLKVLQLVGILRLGRDEGGLI